jgi:alkylation response protein AidB-like acyl-CoA dehydrogenase
MAARLERSALDKADFAKLRDAGLTLTGVPQEMGGVWQSGARSTRPTGAIFRTLARVDPSVALVATMHPTVLALWLEEPVEPPVDPNAWREQRDRVLTAAKAGYWFGTISSEPGGGGDLMATRDALKIVMRGADKEDKVAARVRTKNCLLGLVTSTMTLRCLLAGGTI